MIILILHFQPFQPLFIHMNYFFTFLAIAAGAFLIIKTEWVVDNFGTSAWAESKGIGSRFLYKMVGLAMIIISLLAISGILQVMILSIFGPLFGGFK